MYSSYDNIFKIRGDSFLMNMNYLIRTICKKLDGQFTKYNYLIYAPRLSSLGVVGTGVLTEPTVFQVNDGGLNQHVGRCTVPV
jgi:hypothetical protein